MADVDYCDMYLVEAAMADLPLSNTFYDPERDGTGVKSLGVLEHWNNDWCKIQRTGKGYWNRTDLFT